MLPEYRPKGHGSEPPKLTAKIDGFLAEKIFYDIQHLLVIKALEKIGMEETCLNTLKTACKKPIDDFMPCWEN